MDYAKLVKFFAEQQQSMLIPQDFVIPESVQGFLNSNQILQYTIELILELEPSEGDLLQQIYTALGYQHIDENQLIALLVQKMKQSALYFEDLSDSCGNEIRVDDEKGEILTTSNLNNSPSIQRMPILDNNSLENSADQNTNLKEPSADNEPQIPEPVQAPVTVVQLTTKKQIAPFKMDLSDLSEKNEKCASPNVFDHLDDENALKSSQIVQTPVQNSLKCYQDLVSQLEQHFKVKINVNNFDPQMLKSDDCDVAGLQKLYQDQQEEYDQLYTENSLLKQQLKQIENNAQKYCKNNNITYSSVENTFNAMQNNSSIQSPETEMKLSQKLQTLSKGFRSREQDYAEQVQLQKNMIMKLQTEKLKQDQIIIELRKQLDGLQMRLGASKRAAADYGLEKMKGQAQELMKKAERLGFK
ncbi:Hypothetical_protein [Hexamita inflata]|uniref:Hypothetical_protein n=1 Tax=Hexamita inflata TaxID=28002 RepID=A0AA86RL18_9EUKA|nr:Hypothetical protein HINF_LOCUS61599 [Hexamita inflata]